MITLEQRPFYLASSMPYFAIALALLPKSTVQYSPLFFLKTNHTLFTRILIVMIVLAVLVLPFIHTIPKRESGIIHDLSILNKQIPENSTIQVSETTMQRWNYHAYFMRYGKISLDASGKHEFYLVAENEPLPLDTCFEKINLPLETMILLHCEN
jgi:hypothetical protein